MIAAILHCYVIFLANTEIKHEHQETKREHNDAHEDESYNWFKDTFLNSKRKLKKEIYEKLRRYILCYQLYVYLKHEWQCFMYSLINE